jgi:homogentisate 1,2-dioxygenase
LFWTRPASKKRKEASLITLKTTTTETTMAESEQDKDAAIAAVQSDTKHDDDDANTNDHEDDEHDDEYNDPFTYLTGFGNEISSEMIVGAVPLGRNNPKLVPYGLYTEQLSGTAFTVPGRSRNRRTWLYRIRPLVATIRSTTTAMVNPPTLWFLGRCDPATCVAGVIDPLRWCPLKDILAVAAANQIKNDDKVVEEETNQEYKDEETNASVGHGSDFLDAFYLIACAGVPRNRLAIYQYHGKFATAAKPSRRRRFLQNTDGDWLIVPQQGTLIVLTELGRLYVQPREVCVVPRNIIFTILSSTTDSTTICSGYVLEVDSPIGFELPERGLIGSNGLANARDFLYPTAYVDDDPNNNSHYHHELYVKQEDSLHGPKFITPPSPLDVVGWQGNYLPYKYDLNKFCAMSSISYDHPDPSINTVLTCASPMVGTALADFVVFLPPPLRKMDTTDDHTYRPPWFHRNVMSEYMGLIDGYYEAKIGGGFIPGGASLHNLGVPHGPDAATHDKAIAAVVGKDKEDKDDNDDTHAAPAAAAPVAAAGMAFMFETYLPLRVNPAMLQLAQPDYVQCWQQDGGLEDRFTGWDLLRKQSHINSNNEKDQNVHEKKKRKRY